MILDNLFTTLGGTGTAAILFGMLAMIGAPAFRSVACPSHAIRRSFQRSL
jgi:hypothetical protein